MDLHSVLSLCRLVDRHLPPHWAVLRGAGLALFLRARWVTFSCLTNRQQPHTLRAIVLQDLYPACAPRRQPLQASWRLSELAALIRSYQDVHGLLVMVVLRLLALSCKAHHTLSLLPLSFRKDDREPSAMMSCSATMSSVWVCGRVA